MEDKEDEPGGTVNGTDFVPDGDVSESDSGMVVSDIFLDL